MEGMRDIHIEFLKSRKWDFLDDRKTRELLTKWSLLNGLHISAWAFSQAYDPTKVLPLVSSILDKIRIMGILLPEHDEIRWTIASVPCRITSFDFFDRLLNPGNGIVSPCGDGSIRGCLESSVDNFLVADEFRQMLLNEESDGYNLYSKYERDEMIFRVLMHLALGGNWCQYEDKLQPYIDTAVMIYKTLLKVRKHPHTGQLEVLTKCFRVIYPDGGNIQDFVYIAIDPVLRELIVFAHKF